LLAVIATSPARIPLESPPKSTRGGFYAPIMYFFKMHATIPPAHGAKTEFVMQTEEIYAYIPRFEFVETPLKHSQANQRTNIPRVT